MVDDLGGEGEADSPPTFEVVEPFYASFEEHALEMPIGEVCGDAALTAIYDVEEEELIEAIRQPHNRDDEGVIPIAWIPLNRPPQGLNPMLTIYNPEGLIIVDVELPED